MSNFSEQIETRNFSFSNVINELQNNYKFIKGHVKLIGKQPDGDSVAFVADNYSLFYDLYRGYMAKPPKRDGSIQLRFEGIDAPELHFANFFQPLGEEARNYLLKELLHFSAIDYEVNDIPGQPNMAVLSADPEKIPLVIATNALETNGRPVCYLFKDSDKFPDGFTGPLDPFLLNESINYKMLESGYAYLLSYTSMPITHFQVLKEAANDARQKGKGVWEHDASRDFTLLGFNSIQGKGSQLIYPKLFRRAIGFLKSGAKDFKEWLRSNEDENDQVRITETIVVNLSSLIHQVNDNIYFQADTNDIIFIEK